MNLFIDLENTLINDWFDPVIKHENIEIIKNFIKEHNIDKGTIFSMAIWTEDDKLVFDNKLKTILEKSLEIKLDAIPLKNVFDNIIKKHNIIETEFCNVFLFDQKEELFKQWLITSNMKGKFVLFDDTVNDSWFINKNLTIILKHI